MIAKILSDRMSTYISIVTVRLLLHIVIGTTVIEWLHSTISDWSHWNLSWWLAHGERGSSWGSQLEWHQSTWRSKSRDWTWHGIGEHISWSIIVHLSIWIDHILTTHLRILLVAEPLVILVEIVSTKIVLVLSTTLLAFSELHNQWTGCSLEDRRVLNLKFRNKFTDDNIHLPLG